MYHYLRKKESVKVAADSFFLQLKGGYGSINLCLNFIRIYRNRRVKYESDICKAA